MATKVKKEKTTTVHPGVNILSQPRVTKVVVSAGVGKKRDDRNYLEAVVRDLKAITGQQPQTRHARQAIAGFNVRQGNLVGYRVTLRGRRRDDFIRRLVHLTLPRVRDFRGIPAKALDGHGNLSLGIAEQLAFPEINADKTDIIFGLEVTLTTSAQTNEEAIALFRSLGFPMTQNNAKFD